MQLPLDRLLTDWSTPEEPEPLVISEVLHQVTPVFRHPHHPNWPDKGQEIQGHYTSEEDTGYSASSLPPPKALIAETGLVDLYKMLGSRSPDSKPGHLAGPVTVLPVDYLPTHEGYLPSNIEYLPSHEAPITDPLEELKPQHISLSIFPSSSLHPLTFSCDKKLTLDRLKMGCSSLMLWVVKLGKSMCSQPPMCLSFLAHTAPVVITSGVLLSGLFPNRGQTKSPGFVLGTENWL